MFSQYHESSPGTQVNPLSHNSSSFSNGSLLHGSPIDLRHTSQQPHLSFTTPVLQLFTGGHASFGSGQFPALSHQQALHSGIGIGVCAVMHDRYAKSKELDDKNFFISVASWKKKKPVCVKMLKIFQRARSLTLPWVTSNNNNKNRLY